MLIIVTWRRGEERDGDHMVGKLIKENHVFISPDKRKSCEFVWHCIIKVLDWFAG
jgi:hypothetical protein